MIYSYPASTAKVSRQWSFERTIQTSMALAMATRLSHSEKVPEVAEDLMGFLKH